MTMVAKTTDTFRWNFKWAILIVLGTILNDRQNEPNTTSEYVIYLQVVVFKDD